jgi:hypothetical protein
MLLECPVCRQQVRGIPDVTTDPPTLTIGRHLRKKIGKHGKRFEMCVGSGMKVEAVQKGRKG